MVTNTATAFLYAFNINTPPYKVILILDI